MRKPKVVRKKITRAIGISYWGVRIVIITFKVVTFSYTFQVNLKKKVPIPSLLIRLRNLNQTNSSLEGMEEENSNKHYSHMSCLQFRNENKLSLCMFSVYDWRNSEFQLVLVSLRFQISRSYNFIKT